MEVQGQSRTVGGAGASRVSHTRQAAEKVEIQGQLGTGTGTIGEVPRDATCCPSPL